MKRIKVEKFMEVATERPFLAALALGITVTALTVRAATDNALPVSSSDRQQIVVVSPDEGQDSFDSAQIPEDDSTSNVVLGTVPLKAACCNYLGDTFTNICTPRQDVIRCRANGGVPIPSCAAGCPLVFPRIGADEELSDAAGDDQDPNSTQGPTNPVSTRSAWTMLFATLFLAGL